MDKELWEMLPDDPDELFDMIERHASYVALAEASIAYIHAASSFAEKDKGVTEDDLQAQAIALYFEAKGFMERVGGMEDG